MRLQFLTAVLACCLALTASQVSHGTSNAHVSHAVVEGSGTSSAVTRNQPSDIDWEASGNSPDDEDGDVVEGSGNAENGDRVEGSGLPPPPSNIARQPESPVAPVVTKALTVFTTSTTTTTRAPLPSPIATTMVTFTGDEHESSKIAPEEGDELHFNEGFNDDDEDDEDDEDDDEDDEDDEDIEDENPVTEPVTTTTIKAIPTTTTTEAEPETEATTKRPPFIALTTAKPPRNQIIPGGDESEDAFHNILKPGILAAITGGAVVGVLLAILLIMFIVYRIRKKDEGSYSVDEGPHAAPRYSYGYQKAATKEFYA